MSSTKRNLLVTAARSAPHWWASRLRNPIFVIGCGRSGTTVLSTWLSSHRDIANLSEANDIWDPLGYPWARSANGRKSAPIWIDAEAYTARWWEDNRQRGGEIRAIFGTYQTLKRASVFVNKTPLNTFRIPHLLEMFPDARLIHIVRDGRAVAYSYAQKQRADIDKDAEVYRQAGFDYPFEQVLMKVASHWRCAVEEVARQDSRFGLTTSGRLLEVTYESLCQHTDDVLAEMSKFMGIRPDRFRPSSGKITMRNQNFKWQKELPGELAEAVTRLQEPALKQWGYIT